MNFQSEISVASTLSNRALTVLIIAISKLSFGRDVLKGMRCPAESQIMTRAKITIIID